MSKEKQEEVKQPSQIQVVVVMDKSGRSYRFGNADFTPWNNESEVVRILQGNAILAQFNASQLTGVFKELRELEK